MVLSSHYKYLSLALGLLLVALPNPAVSQESPRSPVDTVTHTDTDTDTDTNTTVPHHGCLLFLKEDHTPQAMLVGRDFEAVSTTGYTVDDEAGSRAATCVDGKAGGYPCNNIDLLSMLPISELSSLSDPSTDELSDIWGWTHSGSNREFALVGMYTGTAFVEITDPYNPVHVGNLPAKTGQESSWRDIKTFGDYAFIVSEGSRSNKSVGMDIFSLDRLLDAEPNSIFTEDAHYDGFGNAHNIFINEDSATAYVVGSNTCNGGLHMLDLTNPLEPVFTGCHSNDGYTHDVHCVIYGGPDTDHVGKEICVGSNTNEVMIYNKSTSRVLSRKTYAGFAYTHQGWLTKDHKFFIFGDEMDETQRGGKTRTHVLKVTDLDNPVYIGYYSGRTNAIDHNLYIVDDLMYQANYRAGLNILKISDPSIASFEEEGFFDVYPDSDSANFNGAWSNYPFFPSGNIILSGIEQGLFVLKHTTPTASPAPTTSAPTTSTPTTLPSQPPSIEPSTAECYEFSSAIFFKNENPMTCKRLRSKKEENISRLCETTMASEVCKVTCDVCTCGEIDTQKFFAKKTSTGGFRYRRCLDLMEMNADKKANLCALDAPRRSKHPPAKLACPVTCGLCVVLG